MTGPIEGFNPTRFGRTLHGRQVFADFAQRFSEQGDTRIAGGKDRRLVARNFTVDDAMLDDFKTFVTTEARIPMDAEGWTKDLTFIRAMIRYEIDAALFSMEDARRHLVADDPQAQYALSLFGEAEGLTRLTAATRQASRQK
jgi:carboxyl-terminal processing protease